MNLHSWSVTASSDLRRNEAHLQMEPGSGSESDRLLDQRLQVLNIKEHQSGVGGWAASQSVCDHQEGLKVITPLKDLVST